MGIWIHSDHDLKKNRNPSQNPSSNRSESFRFNTNCIYCSTKMIKLSGNDIPEVAYKGNCFRTGCMLGCPICGWWTGLSLRGEICLQAHDDGFIELRQRSGVLKNLNLNDLSLPLNELRNYLVAKYDDRFNIHPRKYEELVGGVFSDFGYRVRITSYSGDDGIDLYILDGKDDATVGIQVKRYKNNISVEQIRSFVGALMLKGLTTGIFVTTSDYERGAKNTADIAEFRLALGITLMDSKRFYEALKISTRSSLWDAEDLTSPYYETWQDIKEYVDTPLDKLKSQSWINNADYIWGTAW